MILTHVRFSIDDRRGERTYVYAECPVHGRIYSGAYSIERHAEANEEAIFHDALFH